MVLKRYSWYHMHISLFIHSVVLVFGNEEKLVVIRVHSLFRRVATSMFRRLSVFTSSGSQVRQAVIKRRVNTESLRIQYSSAAQHSYKNHCDVTTLVATERVRNKYSLLESFIFYSSSILLIN